MPLKCCTQYVSKFGKLRWGHGIVGKQQLATVTVWLWASNSNFLCLSTYRISLNFIFIRRTDAEAYAPILWPPDGKTWLTGKDPDAGKDWRQEKKGTIEDEMVGRHHWLNGHEWVSSESWWWTGKPGVLQSMGLQRVGHNWATEVNWSLD